jgi:GMP synthase (glutamine-hydrolysing)
MHSKILILDFGSQVTQLIARRVRDAGVFSEVFPYDVSDEFVRNYGASGIILSGSHNSTLEGDSPRAPQPACRCWASATACRPWRPSWAVKLKTA